MDIKTYLSGFDKAETNWFDRYVKTINPRLDAYRNEGVPFAGYVWRLFALYISVSAITSIVWAKYFAPDELDNIMGLNKSVLTIFDDMANPIPTWYR